MSEKSETDLERAQELFAFLQGTLPEGYKVPEDHIPKLTAEQANTVIWYLGNLYWQVPDTIERCDICGDLYDRSSGGDFLDFGDLPQSFCESCTSSWEYETKKVSPENPENKK